MDSSQLSRVITFGIQSHRSLEKQGRVQPTNFAAEKVLGKGAHKVFDEMPKPNFNSNSHRTLLVTVSNTIYPINETVLHQVFDSFGKVEMIHILPVKDDFQALVRYEHSMSASLASSSLHRRNIYDDCCKLVIQMISRDFLEKAEYYYAMCVDSWEEISLRSCFFELMLEVEVKEVVEMKNHKVCEEMPLKKTSSTGCPSPFRRLEFPVFDGNQPREWIRECEEYFRIHATSDKYKVTLAMTYMQGRTRRWRKGYDERMGDPTWSDFAAAILGEFENFKSGVECYKVVCEEAIEPTKETEKITHQECDGTLELVVSEVVSLAPRARKEIEVKGEMVMTQSRKIVIDTKEGGFVMLKVVGSGVFDKVLAKALEARIESKENDEQLANELEKIVVEPEGVLVNGDIKTNFIGIVKEDNDCSFPHSFDPGGIGKSELFVYSYFSFRRHVEFLREFMALQIMQSLLVSRFESHTFSLIDKAGDIEKTVKPVAGFDLGNYGAYPCIKSLSVDEEEPLCFGSTFLVSFDVFPYSFKSEKWRSLRTRIMLGTGNHNRFYAIVSSRRKDYMWLFHDEGTRRPIGHSISVMEDMKVLREHICVVDAMNIELFTRSTGSMILSGEFESINTINRQEENESKCYFKPVSKTLLWVQELCSFGNYSMCRSLLTTQLEKTMKCILCLENDSILIQAEISRHSCWFQKIRVGKISLVNFMGSHELCLFQINCHVYNDWRFLHKLLSFEEKFGRSVIALRICVICHYSFCGFIMGVMDQFGEIWKSDEMFVGKSEVAGCRNPRLVGTVLAKGGRVPGVSDLVSGAYKIFFKQLQKDESTETSSKPKYDSLMQQVKSLQNELSVFASNSITIVTQNRPGFGIYGIIVIVVTVGYRYVWWKGWRISDMMFTTKCGLNDACSSIAATRKHLSSRIDRVDRKIDECGKNTAATRDGVSELRSDVKQIGSDFQSVHHVARSLETKISRIEVRQNETNFGVMELVNFVRGLCTTRPIFSYMFLIAWNVIWLHIGGMKESMPKWLNIDHCCKLERSCELENFPASVVYAYAGKTFEVRDFRLLILEDEDFSRAEICHVPGLFRKYTDIQAHTENYYILGTYCVNRICKSFIEHQY